MSGLTSGKDYPIKWPRKVTAAFVGFYLLVVVALAVFGLYKGDDWLDILVLVGGSVLIAGVSAVPLATVINGLLIWGEVRKKHPRAELTRNQKRAQVGVPLATIAVIVLATAIRSLHLFGTNWSWVLAIVVYVIGLPILTRPFLRGISVEEFQALQKRRSEIEDEMQFTKDKPNKFF